MEQKCALVLLIFLLQLNNTSSISENPIDKGCLVKNDLLFIAQEADSFRVSFFIKPKNPIKFQISFLGRKRNEDNDLLILEPNSGKIQSRRDDRATTYDITLNNTIPHGWNDLTINVADKKMDIGNIYTHTGYENVIESVLFTGNYLTNCTSRTPIWEIDKSSPITVPLTGLSRFEIRLYSNEVFDPDLTLNTIDIPLSYDGELVIGKSNISFPPDDYTIFIEKHSNFLSIFNSNTNEESMLLMKVKMKENLTELAVRTLEGDFFLILDPFQKNELELETTVLTTTTTTDNLTEKYSKCEDPSSIIWKITTGIATGVAVILILILMIISCLTKRNIKEEVRKVFGKTIINSKSKKSHEEFTLEVRPSNEVLMEEGDALLGIQENVHIKDRIKLENTELHGESNPNIRPCYKEVCKLKLKSEKSKKMLSEADCRKSNKVILVVGQTGSGKSSFINGMINFIYGVTYEDTFRFKLIDDMDKSDASGTNNTDEIMAYYIPFIPGIIGNCSYIFIDTPGFGDSRGIDEDKKWNHKFYKFLDENPDINEVDGICFVMKITDTRLTVTHRYIINGLFSMFGKDIYKNIYAVVSYFDGSETQVPVMLKESGIDYNIAIKFNSIGLYNDTEFPSKPEEYINKKFVQNWNLIIENMNHFFNHLKKATAVSLSLTNIVLEEYKDIEKLKDEILELKSMEPCATDNESHNIQSKIEQNKELLNVKLDEAQKLDWRLKNITYKNLINNDYIDILIEKEREQNKKSELYKLKERNKVFNEILKEKKSIKRLVSYILGDKTEKIE